SRQAQVYPILSAAVDDVTDPSWPASVGCLLPVTRSGLGRGGSAVPLGHSAAPRWRAPHLPIRPTSLLLQLSTYLTSLIAEPRHFCQVENARKGSRSRRTDSPFVP